MRKISLISTLLLWMVGFSCLAQNYGNEWIDFSRPYYKLYTAEDGIYRVTYDELVRAGFPVNTVDPRKIKLYHRGIEQAIIFNGQNDARFDAQDYFEFYGRKNDGTLDTELYVSPEAQQRTYYNFNSDTTAYFLTYSLTDNGKRVITFKENNILNLPPESYYIRKYQDIQVSNFSGGLRYPLGIPGAESYLSAFDYGEGWTGAAFTKGQYRDVVFQGLNLLSTTGPGPVLEVLLTGGNSRAHHVELSVGPDASSLRLLDTINFSYYYDTLITDTLAWTDLAGGNFVCRVNIPDLGNADRISISMTRLHVAEMWDQQNLDNKEYYLPGTNSNRSYIEIKNVNAGASLLDITNENNIVEISYNTVGNDINAVIQNDAEGKKLLLASTRIQVPKIQQISMREIDPTRANFLIITHKRLRQATSKYADVPVAYGAYRASAAGGGYDTLVMNIDQLYDIFSYGEYTPLAIYRFCRFMAERGNPKYLFIMGKGLTGPYLYAARHGNNGENNRDLVPTAGYPGSDNLFTAGLRGATFEVGFPVGRVSAESPAALEAYLDKVKEMENTPHDALWRKQLVHLSGGSDPFQQSLFRRYVDDFKAVAEGKLLGGDVVTIGKKTNGPTELINIAEHVNDGKLLITFFGHSASFSADIEIGNVSNDGMGYHNKGKYPMLIVNGCNAGDMFNTGYGFGEDWIGTADRGAVGFIAHTGAGLTILLKKYTDIFYEVAFTDSLYINKGIGDIMKEVATRYLQRNANSQMDISQIQEMTLQGDPAVSLFGVTKPDFELNADNVFVQSVDGLPVNAFSESFDLGLIVNNYGAAADDSLKITVRQTLSSGRSIVLDTMVYHPVYYSDTLFFNIPSAGMDSYGQNQFAIKIDPKNEIDELNELNNETIFNYFIRLGGTKNVYPRPFAIVNNPSPTLISQSLDLLMDARSYIFELDTTRSFDSPYRKSATIQGGALAKWPVNLFDNLPQKDTLVFYWRTKFADLRPEEPDLWSTTSFTFIQNGQPGWAMAHFDQFEDNKLQQLVLDRPTKSWDFEHFSTHLTVRTFGNLHPDYDYIDVELTINNTPYIFPTRLCSDNSINMLSFDQVTTLPYLVLGKPFILDRKNCGRIPQVINNMLKSEIESNLRIEQYIDNVKPGDFVLLFSIGLVTYESWPATTVAKLSEIGVDANDLQSLVNGEPVIILGKKGSAPGSASIIKADYTSPTPANQQEILLDQVIEGQSVNGVVTSPKIGPATHWTSFYQQSTNLEMPVTDTYSFTIWGVKPSGEEVPLIENIQARTADLQAIDPDIYPYIRIEMKNADPTNLTPAQLKQWFVSYAGVPEGLIRYKDNQPVGGIAIAEGKSITADFLFENVSDLPYADSVAVAYTMYNQQARKSFTDTLNILQPAPMASTPFQVQLETLDKPGKNDLKIFANPYMQPEQSFNNNILNFPDYLDIQSDRTNPILEVTLDGQFIMDGDIVSPSPLIVLRMKDENTTLLKEDTLGVNLYLNAQCQGCEPTRISFSSPLVKWSPATPEKDFTVEYQADNLADGIYTLQAEASDASGNSSGKEPYSVNFEVINESQITNFFPYPNPFSSHTQFVFTLTGSEIPDQIIIQIMTVNGTVVREITQDEIGPLKIGHNKTDYAWDGKDEYGDQLANGVYLYKVKIYMHGKEITHRATAADKSFKNGIGKMYLLR